MTADGTEVGMLHVEHRPTEIYLARIELHPDHQGRGIGSRLIRSLLHQARQQGRDLPGRPRRQPAGPGPLPATGPARSHLSR
ncbi:GNAT family N-acetyltransferase [Kitasatospora cathayae]|uniref:GNAT family N-acetyltransferase n=1 Tax=Kitasatospora cathayae TaxID=3004092 RepID=UPI0038601B6B